MRSATALCGRQESWLGHGVFSVAPPTSRGRTLHPSGVLGIYATSSGCCVSVTCPYGMRLSENVICSRVFSSLPSGRCPWCTRAESTPCPYVCRARTAPPTGRHSRQCSSSQPSVPSSLVIAAAETCAAHHVRCGTSRETSVQPHGYVGTLGRSSQSSA
jgi:hypothetical protein